MILPDKHIRLAESLLGLGGFVLESLSQAKTIDSLWDEFHIAYESHEYPAYHTFENLVLAISFLHSIGVVEQDEKGRLLRCA